MKLSLIIPLKSVDFDTLYGMKNKIVSTFSESNIDYEAIFIINESFKPSTELSDYDDYKEHFKFVCSKKPLGIFESRRKGLSKATGDFVWFVDSTDNIIYQPECIENLKDFDVSCYLLSFSGKNNNDSNSFWTRIQEFDFTDDVNEYNRLNPFTTRHIIKKCLHPFINSFIFKTEYIKSVYEKLPKINDFNRLSGLYLLTAALKYMKSFKVNNFNIYSVDLKDKYYLNIEELSKYNNDTNPLFALIKNDVYFNDDDLKKLNDVLDLEGSSIVSKEITEFIELYRPKKDTDKSND